MKYVSLDLETTGLDPKDCQVLEIGMVHEDTENHGAPVEDLPHYRGLFSHPLIVGEPVALRMNRELLEEASRRGAHPGHAWEEVRIWLLGQGYDPDNKANLAGKNVGKFDYQFLPPYIQEFFNHRCIDPGSVFIDWGSERIPGLQTLLGEKAVAHTALEDAQDVVRLLRRAYSLAAACYGVAPPPGPLNSAEAIHKIGSPPYFEDGMGRREIWAQVGMTSAAQPTKTISNAQMLDSHLRQWSEVLTWCDRYNELRGVNEEGKPLGARGEAIKKIGEPPNVTNRDGSPRMWASTRYGEAQAYTSHIPGGHEHKDDRRDLADIKKWCDRYNKLRGLK